MSGRSVRDVYDLTGRVALVTGGAGLLGLRHAEAIAEMGGVPVIVDVDGERAAAAAGDIARQFGVAASASTADITDERAVHQCVGDAMRRYQRIDILVNNAALTVKGGGPDGDEYFAPFERYPLRLWEKALRVNLTGAFLMTQAVGRVMVEQRRGVVVNIASDVAMISPDHRIYEGMVSPSSGKPFNTPLSYATTKGALLSLTRYLATYWAPHNIRVNALSPAGVFDGHQPEFVSRLANLIPLGRMADRDEYKGALVFLVSDASSFMTGANLVVDGGRSAW
jgi:NAD(P)-dependent dehydrogenase (short-subunit alcohol dehydrogenase family)